MKKPDVVRVRTDMCQFGMTSRTGRVGRALGQVVKPIGFLTNCSHIDCELRKRCPRLHEHVPLVGGRAAAAAIYIHIAYVAQYAKGSQRKLPRILDRSTRHS